MRPRRLRRPATGLLHPVLRRRTPGSPDSAAGGLQRRLRQLRRQDIVRLPRGTRIPQTCSSNPFYSRPCARAVDTAAQHGRKGWNHAPPTPSPLAVGGRTPFRSAICCPPPTASAATQQQPTTTRLPLHLTASVSLFVTRAPFHPLVLLVHDGRRRTAPASPAQAQQARLFHRGEPADIDLIDLPLLALAILILHPCRPLPAPSPCAAATYVPLPVHSRPAKLTKPSPPSLSSAHSLPRSALPSAVAPVAQWACPGRHP